MAKVILESSDHETFLVDLQIAMMFTAIKTMLEDLGVSSEAGNEEKIPLLNVRGEILKLVIQWAQQHRDEPPEDDDSRAERTDDISQWDRDFLKVEQSILFDLIKAANYLDIKGLLDITCKTVANMLKGKTPVEIRRMLNIQNEFTPPAEEERIHKSEWCEK